MRERGDAAGHDQPAAATIAGALGQLHRASAIRALIQLLPHQHQQIRLMADWALGTLDAADAEPALRTAFERGGAGIEPTKRRATSPCRF